MERTSLCSEAATYAGIDEESLRGVDGSNQSREIVVGAVEVLV